MKVETVRVTDPHLTGVWGNVLRRLVIRPRVRQATGQLALTLRAD